MMIPSILISLVLFYLHSARISDAIGCSLGTTIGGGCVDDELDSSPSSHMGVAFNSSKAPLNSSSSPSPSSSSNSSSNSSSDSSSDSSLMPPAMSAANLTLPPCNSSSSSDPKPSPEVATAADQRLESTKNRASRKLEPDSAASDEHGRIQATSAPQARIECDSFSPADGFSNNFFLGHVLDELAPASDRIGLASSAVEEDSEDAESGDADAESAADHDEEEGQVNLEKIHWRSSQNLHGRDLQGVTPPPSSPSPSN